MGEITSFRNFIRPIINASGLIILSTISACGGGGGGNVRPNSAVTSVPVVVPPPVTPAQNDPAAFRTTEFNLSNNLGSIGAEYAYADGLTGKGVTIGILDFNFDFSSPEVNYAPGSTGPNQTYIDMYEAQTGDTANTEPHGHAVAVFAAGARNMVATQGVAYDASVLAVDYFSGVNMHEEQQGSVTYHVSNPYTYMTDRGAKVINISIGYDEGDIITNPPKVSDNYTTDSPLYAMEAGAILVTAAGNGGDPEPMLSDLDIMDNAQNAGLLPNGTGALIIVGSVDQNNKISSFSNQAGRAQNIYLVAPGEELVFPYQDTTGSGLFTGSGTSFAAPQVAGAAAILFQRWPQLSGRDIANILFNSATDLGAPGTDAVYGRGLLNLRAAVQPIGTVVTTIAGTSGSATPIAQLGMLLSPAFGDASPYVFNHVMGLDRYGRDYYYNLAPRVINRSVTGLNLADAMDNYRYLDAASFPLGSATGSLFVTDTQASQFEFDSWSHYLNIRKDDKHMAAFSLRGNTRGWSWQLGTGLTMAPLLDGRTEQPDRPRTLRLGQQGYLTTSGTFLAASYALSSDTQFAIGIDRDSIAGDTYHPNPVLRDSENRWISAMQLNHSFQNSILGLRLGAIFDKDGVLGSRGAGGFEIADGSTTGFVTLNGYYQLSPAISIEGQVATGLSWVRPARQSSYFAGINDFASSAWSVQLQGKDLGIEHSNWILGVTQPLRVENARVSARVATRIDISTGLPVFDDEQFSLTPTGREVAFEAAWQYRRNKWMVQANLLDRLDAGHIAGRNDLSGILWYRQGF